MGQLFDTRSGRVYPFSVRKGGLRWAVKGADDWIPAARWIGLLPDAAITLRAPVMNRTVSLREGYGKNLPT